MRPWNGREVTWIPSYGPEMRGGTAHCTVVVGDEPIGSPLVRNPDCVIAMNLPSVDKYEPLVKAVVFCGGQHVMNRPFGRSDIRAIALPAHDIALRLADQRLVNMTMLGGLLGLTDLLPLSAVEAALKVELPLRHHHLLDANIAALREGATWVKVQNDIEGLTQ